jgi:NADPH2 dehydrogenase
MSDRDQGQALPREGAVRFDGVEMYGANRYLVDQLTQDTCNNRTDAYGHSVENRSRLGLQVAEVMVDAVGCRSDRHQIKPVQNLPRDEDEGSKPTFSH